MMKDYVYRYAAQGKKCLFVGAVGDNFYMAGLRDMAQWNKQWLDVYGTNDPNSALYNIPWLATMGNHDFGNDDVQCACNGYCKQFNRAYRPPGTEKYWMPDFSWNYYIPEVQLEIIGLDTNAVDVEGLGGDGCRNGAREICNSCGLAHAGQFLQWKKQEGENLLDQRAHSTNATTALILQHYPAVGLELKQRFEAQNGGRARVLSAYGHLHDQVCDAYGQYGCELVLTGGGGAWTESGGGHYFGFTAVHLTDDGGYRTVVESPEVRIPQGSCSWMFGPPLV